MCPVCPLYVPGLCLVCVRNDTGRVGMCLVCRRVRVGVNVVWFGYVLMVCGMQLVGCWCALGLCSVCPWYAIGMSVGMFSGMCWYMVICPVCDLDGFDMPLVCCGVVVGMLCLLRFHHHHQHR